jgi:hypothetical protein
METMRILRGSRLILGEMLVFLGFINVRELCVRGAEEFGLQIVAIQRVSYFAILQFYRGVGFVW